MQRTRIKLFAAGMAVILGISGITLAAKACLTGHEITVIRQEQLAKTYLGGTVEETEYADDAGNVVLELSYRFPEVDASWPVEVASCLQEKHAMMEDTAAEYISWHEHSYPFEYDYEVVPIEAGERGYISFLVYQRALVGGAHADSWYEGWVFDRESGRVMELDDLIQVSDHMVQDIVTALNEAGLNVTAEDIQEEIKDIEFIVEQQGIMLIFQAGAIASYGEGPVSVIVSFEK